MDPLLIPSQSLEYVNAVAISGKIAEYRQDGPNLKAGMVSLQTSKGLVLSTRITDDTILEGDILEWGEGCFYGYLSSFHKCNEDGRSENLYVVATKFVRHDVEEEGTWE